MLGDFLYRLAQHEARAQPVHQRVAIGVKPSLNVALAAANVTSLPFLVPADKIAIISSVLATGAAGAAQTCDRLDLSLNVNNSLDTIAQVASQLFGTLNARVTWFPNRLVLMPNESLTVFGLFNAGAAVNTVGLHVTGLLLPKGNVQLR